MQQPIIKLFSFPFSDYDNAAVVAATAMSEKSKNALLLSHAAASKSLI
jgi:hypothetical protein